MADPASFDALLIFNVTVSSLHLLSTILLCIQVFAEESPVLDVPAYFLLVPICPIKFETNLLYARQAGCGSLSKASSDQYLGFSNVSQRCSESMYHSGSSSPKVSGKIRRLDSQLAIYGQSFDEFHMEHEGLIISFILKTLLHLRHVK